jgi:hypothetical protein
MAERRELARDPTRADRLWALSHDVSWRVREAAARNAALTSGLAAHLSRDTHPRVRRQAARHPLLDRDNIERLAVDPSPEVCAVACARLGRDEAALGGDPFVSNVAVRLVTALRPDTTAGTLLALAVDDDALVRLAVATHPMTPPTALDELVRDGLEPIRHGVASRSWAPEPVWAALARDPAPGVRLAVAGNAAAPGPVLGAMRGRHQTDLPVLRALAANRGLPAADLKKLGGHRRWDIRQAVVSNPACPPTVIAPLSTKAPWAVRAAIAASPHTAPDLLARYRSDNPAVAFSLAGNPALPPELATELLCHPDIFVSGRAAAHPAVDPAALGKFVKGFDRPAWVLRVAATNPACPPNLSEEILTWIALGGTGAENPVFDPVACTGHPGDPGVNEWNWYRTTAAETQEPDVHPLWRVRASTVASRATIPYYLIELLARDPHDGVRRTVARFDGMSVPVLEELCGDADQFAASQAQAALVRRRQRPAPKPTVDGARRPVLIAALAPVIIAIISVLGSSPEKHDPLFDAAILQSDTASTTPVVVPVGDGSVIVDPGPSNVFLAVVAAETPFVVNSLTMTNGEGQPESYGPFTIEPHHTYPIVTTHRPGTPITLFFVDTDGSVHQKVIELPRSDQ